MGFFRGRDAGVAYAVLGFVLATLAGLAPLALLGGDTTGSAPPNPPLPSPSLSMPPHLPTLDAKLQALQGPGPFVIYFADRRVYALDLALPTAKPVIMKSDADYYPRSEYGNGRVLPLSSSHSISLASRQGLREDVFTAENEVRAVAVSRDGRRLAYATFVDPNNNAGARIFITSLDGSFGRKVVEFGTASDWAGGTFQMFWRDDENLTILDACHCDGGPGYSRTSNLSLDGKLEEYEFLESRDPNELGPQHFGSLVTFDDVPSVDCFIEPNPCENLTHTLMVADLDQRRVRSLARQQRAAFGSPQLSPDGRIVATSMGNSDEMTFRDVATGDILATATYRSDNLNPLAWISDSILIAEVYAGDEEALLAFTLSRQTRKVSIRKFAEGAGYLGWIQ